MFREGKWTEYWTETDSEVGQGSVKSTGFYWGQWVVLYTAHRVEGRPWVRGLN